MPTAPTVTTRDAGVGTHVFWLRYHKEIIALIILFVVASIGYGGYRFYTARQDAAGAEALAACKTSQDYQRVIDSYSRTPAGASAYLLLAEAQRKEKNLGGSNTTLQQFIAKDPKHELVSSAQMAIAANLETMGKRDEAIAAYQRVAVNYQQSFNAPAALMAQVRLLKQKGQTDEARRICENMLTQYRNTIWFSQALQELRMLKPKTPALTGPAAAGVAPAIGMPAGPAAPPMIARPAGAPAPSGSVPAKPK